MEELVEIWRDDFDRRKQETALNRFPQFRATLADEDGDDVREAFAEMGLG
jgi:hypothetical protein